MEDTEIQNPGSALGEAIGASMEAALSKYLEPLMQEYSCRLITKGPVNSKTGKTTKLLMYDNFGTNYSIDGIVVNESNQPLIILESKYIRYKKHNRDKASWLCHAHGEIRNRYNSIRSSIAILAGNWSKSSIAMMVNHDINVFVIPFNTISEILNKYGINFNWGEKDRHLAVEAWQKYSALSEEEKVKIADEMIEAVKPSVQELLKKTLSNDVAREVGKVAIEVHTNIGEVKRFEFDSVKDALDFLEDFTMEEMLDNSKAFTIFDTPKIDDSE